MKTYCKILALALLTMLISTTAFAQGPGGAGSNQFTQFREQHKYTFQLTQMVHHIDAINRDPKYRLTQTQAKKVLAVLKPLQSKPKMTQDQAKQALKNLKPIFTVTQLNAMAKIKDPPRFSGGQRPGGGAPGGFNRPDGNSGPSGNRSGAPRMNSSNMKDFNPFFTKVDKSDPRSADRGKRWDKFFSKLEAQAKGSKTTSSKSASKASTSNSNYKPIKAKK